MKNRRLRKGRPFWLPASSFYFLAAAVAIGVFFLVWAILVDSGEENPWIAAGLIASVSMIVAVFLREVILRLRSNSVVSAQRRLDHSLLSAPVPVREEDPRKLTLERNKILLDEITRKSEAAMVFGKLAESHREVFELCAAYLDVAQRELPTIGVGSPRLGAITRGRDRADRLHRRHMLKWAEIEIRSNTQAAAESVRQSQRMEKAERALSAARVAFEHYPDEPDIIRSKNAVEDLMHYLRATEALRRSARSEERGDIERALFHAMDAERSASLIKGDGAENSLPRIRKEIERLRNVLAN